MQILCTADLHLGRRARRLPADADRAVATGDHIWQAIVKAAIARRVDAVLLSGDVVERAGRFADATRPLEDGLRRLAAHRIPVVAVSGNHDFDVLPQLAAKFDPSEFRVLGRGGRWERYVLTVPGRGSLCVDGWSFPDRHVDADPLEQYDLDPPPAGVPVIGMLHGDLNQTGSRYAPFSMAGLLQHPHLWVLGHWHNPVRWGDGQRLRMLYPGSPLALNPKEPGRHGPWLLTVGAGGGGAGGGVSAGDGAVAVAGAVTGGTFVAEQLPLSPTRYETVTVDVTGATTFADVDATVRRSAAEKLAAVATEHGPALRYLRLRLHVVGRTALHDALPHHLRHGLDGLQLQAGQAVATVERWTAVTAPATDEGPTQEKAPARDGARHETTSRRALAGI